MEIMELAGCNVKLSPGTITVKDDAGKTRGMVRGLRRFKDAQANVQMDFFKEVRVSGLWGNPCTDLSCLYIDGESLFYLYDTRKDEMYTEYNLGKFEADKKLYEGRQTLLKSIAYNSKITVIPCRVV